MTKLEEIKKGHKIVLDNGINSRENEKKSDRIEKKILLGVTD